MTLARVLLDHSQINYHCVVHVTFCECALQCAQLIMMFAYTISVLPIVVVAVVGGSGVAAVG